jgi:uncharacterized protein
MIDVLKQPWHWAIAGTLIGLTVPVLLLLGNKRFGISASLRQVCAMCLPANIPLFKYDWKKENWNLVFVIGTVIGGFLAAHFLSNPHPVEIAERTKASLEKFGITDFTQLMPSQIFNFKSLFTLKGFFIFVVGGFLVGFGTRYAGGCTSGHSIFGLANLQMPSLIATCCFMLGGFLSANILVPLIFRLF